MHMGILTAFSGRIIISSREYLNDLQGKKTVLEMALNDGAPDYNYCKGEVEIVAVNTSGAQVRVNGRILYGGNWRPFAGEYGDGEVSFDFLDLEDQNKPSGFMSFVRKCSWLKFW